MIFIGAEAEEHRQFRFDATEALGLDEFRRNPAFQRVRDWWRRLCRLLRACSESTGCRFRTLARWCWSRRDRRLWGAHVGSDAQSTNWARSSRKPHDSRKPPVTASRLSQAQSREA